MLFARRASWHVKVLVCLLWAVGMVGLSGQARLAQARSRSSAAQQAQRTRQIRRQVQEQGLRSAAVDQRFLQRHKTRYAVEVPHTAIRDQEKSGRCWAYAWTKTVESMARNKGRESGSLSASFINYHALRTLAHGAIDQARRTADHPENHTYSLDADMLGEGGYSHWANHIVKRHGIVPESKMRSNTFDSRESHILQNKLHRLVTAAYRDLWHTSDGAKKTRRKIATKYKKKVDQLLKTMIGAPPRRFTVDGKTYTPRTYRQDYLKLADSDLEFVCLSNDPTRAWNRRYRETYYGKGIPDNQTYNVSMGTIQGAVKRSLRDGVAVNVAVNVDWDNPHRVAPRDHESSQTNGVMSLAAFNYGKLAPTVKLTKHDRMEHGVSLSNHMMAITGYQPRKRGQQARWQVDNSHGSGHFRGGRLDMYDDFFRHYVEEVTVPRGMVPKSVLQKIESKPALDAVTGLPSMTAPKRGTTWKTRRKRAVVQALMREDLSFAEAAKRYKVPVKRVREWHDTAQKAMSRALRATNQ